jgi:ribosomal protein L40E
MSALPEAFDAGAHLWCCPMCTAANAPEHTTCRVCRTGVDGAGVALSRTVEEDTFAPAPLRQVIPFALALLALGAFAASHVPKASTWGGGVAPGGWQVGVRVNRAQELRIATRDLRALVEEYQQAVRAGSQPDHDWSRRLATLRTTWEIYGNGERFPGLEGPEVELAAAMQDLASLRATARDGHAIDSLDRGLRSVVARIQKTEEHLADVD